MFCRTHSHSTFFRALLLNPPQKAPMAWPFGLRLSSSTVPRMSAPVPASGTKEAPEKKKNPPFSSYVDSASSSDSDHATHAGLVPVAHEAAKGEKSRPPMADTRKKRRQRSDGNDDEKPTTDSKSAAAKRIRRNIMVVAAEPSSASRVTVMTPSDLLFASRLLSSLPSANVAREPVAQIIDQLVSSYAGSRPSVLPGMVRNKWT